MASSQSLRRDDAARLLGVSRDADATTVRRAFRAWASLSHPDHGGDPRAFRALCAARDTLLAARDTLLLAAVETDRGPQPRQAWRTVLIRPRRVDAAVLALGGIVSVATVVAAGWINAAWGVIPAAVLAAAWCVAVSRLLLRGADHGHIIVVRSWAWVAVASAQMVLAGALGIAVIEVLPLLVLPFVMVIAAVNPGAGLRRTSTSG